MRAMYLQYTLIDLVLFISHTALCYIMKWRIWVLHGVSQQQGHNSFRGFPCTFLSNADTETERSNEFEGLFIVSKYGSILDNWLEKFPIPSS